MIGEEFLTAPCIRYDRATYAQRALWRWSMLGDRDGLPDWELTPEELQRLAGAIPDARTFEFQARHGFTLYRPTVAVRND